MIAAPACPNGKVRVRRYPCAECPWRCDTKPGKFSAERYRSLRDTTGTPGHEAPIGSPLFACHKSPEGHEEVCAGWLAAVGVESLEVRVLAATRRIDGASLAPGEGWPELFTSYAEMEARQARRD